MRYTTIVDKSEETLNMIIGKAEEFDQERVLNGLDMRHYTQEEVRMLTSLVTEYHAKLQREIVEIAGTGTTDLNSLLYLQGKHNKGCKHVY